MSTVIDLTNKHADDAANGIVDIINAAAKAKTSQIELQQKIMLDQLSRARNREDKKLEQQDQVNNWGQMFGNDTAAQGNPSTNNSGIANGATPAQVGSSPTQPVSGQTPDMGPKFGLPGANENPLTTAMPNTMGRPMPTAPAPVAPTTNAPIATNMPTQPVQSPSATSSQYTDLGFTPIGLGQLGMARKGNPEPKDYAYIQALRKIKQGTASDGEIEFVKDFNGFSKSDQQKMKQTQEDQKQWSTFIKQNTPDTASSRSTFGIASRSNLQAGRVIQTLKNNPNVTYQDLGNVVADLAGIYQGGAPTDQGMKHQQYESLYTAVQNMKQWATGHPQNAVPQGFKDKILGVAQQTIDLNNTVLNKHFDAQEAAQKKLIAKFPDEWKSFREFAAQDYMGGNTNTNDSNAGGGGEKTYGGLTIAQAKEQGFTGYDTDTGKWVK